MAMKHMSFFFQNLLFISIVVIICRLLLKDFYKFNFQFQIACLFKELHSSSYAILPIQLFYEFRRQYITDLKFLFCRIKLPYYTVKLCNNIVVAGVTNVCVHIERTLHHHSLYHAINVQFFISLQYLLQYNAKAKYRL